MLQQIEWSNDPYEMLGPLFVDDKNWCVAELPGNSCDWCVRLHDHGWMES